MYVNATDPVRVACEYDFERRFKAVSFLDPILQECIYQLERGERGLRAIPGTSVWLISQSFLADPAAWREDWCGVSPKTA